MRTLTLIVLILSTLTSCKQTLKNKKREKLKEKTELINENNQTFQSIKYQNIGVILTNELTIYDLHKSKVRTIRNLFGEIVKIDSISKNKYDIQNTGDKCNLLNFVKVSSKKINGWVYTSKIYEKQIKSNLKRDTTLIFNQIKIEILPSKNFNIGVYDENEGMLSFCSGNDNPVILYNNLFNKYETVILENQTKEKDIYNDNYFTLDAHDGWYDKILTSNLKGNILTLEIKREFQEGESIITVEIKLDKVKTTGKIIKYEKLPL